MPFKTFEDGVILPASDLQLLMNQSIINVPNADALATIPTPEIGMVAYVVALNVHVRRVTGRWVPLAGRITVADLNALANFPFLETGLIATVTASASTHRYSGTEWVTQDTQWMTLAPVSGSGFSNHPTSPAAVCLRGGKVEFSGILYRATAPTAFTTAVQLPQVDGKQLGPRGQVRYAGRHDLGMYVAITPPGEFQILANLAATSGAGYPLDGISFAP